MKNKKKQQKTGFIPGPDSPKKSPLQKVGYGRKGRGADQNVSEKRKQRRKKQKRKENRSAVISF